MGMGGKRRTNKHLPRRVYEKHGAYWFVDPQNKWHRLASDYPQALVALATLMNRNLPAVTVELLIARFKAEELPAKAKATQKSRLQELKQIEKVFGHMAPDEVEPSDVWNFYRARGETIQAKHEVRALSAVISFGRRIGACKIPNPCFKIFPKDGAHKPRNRYVTDEEFLIVRDLAPEMIGFAMDAAWIGGFRKNDIIRMERKHLTSEGVQYEPTKDGKFSLIEWNDELHMAFDGALRMSPRVRQYVFCTREGKQFTPDGFNTAWQRLMSKAMKNGLKQRFTFHDLRAKSASDAGSDEEAAARLNHASTATTRRVYRRKPRRAQALRILDKPHGS
jgi:integrase